MYHIYDIKTSASADIVIKAAAKGLTMNTNSIVQNRPLQMGIKIPEKPGRFNLVNVNDIFKGTGIGGFMGGAGGTTMRVANCDGAVWSSKAVREIPGSSNLTLYSCIYAYKSGYHLNMYAVFVKSSGGLSGILGNATSAVIGTPEQWVNKTFIDTVSSVQETTRSSMIHIEGQPELGETPAISKL
ncbi:MAG: hypothetical protein Q7T25_02455 [Sideroxyarcus sp.]|nr:hypothetical protein [Sideroxyarcus sp.]